MTFKIRPPAGSVKQSFSHTKGRHETTLECPDCGAGDFATPSVLAFHMYGEGCMGDGAAGDGCIISTDGEHCVHYGNGDWCCYCQQVQKSQDPDHPEFVDHNIGGGKLKTWMWLGFIGVLMATLIGGVIWAYLDGADDRDKDVAREIARESREAEGVFYVRFQTSGMYGRTPTAQVFRVDCSAYDKDCTLTLSDLTWEDLHDIATWPE